MQRTDRLYTFMGWKNVPVLKLNNGTLVVESNYFYNVSDAIPVKCKKTSFVMESKHRS